MSHAIGQIIDNETLERKRAELDFENVWAKLANMEWHELKAACKYAYDSGRATGKQEGIRLIVETAKERL